MTVDDFVDAGARATGRIALAWVFGLTLITLALAFALGSTRKRLDRLEAPAPATESAYEQGWRDGRAALAAELTPQIEAIHREFHEGVVADPLAPVMQQAADVIRELADAMEREPSE